MDLETWTAQTIPECFERISAQRVHATAVASPGRSIRYGELAREAARLADTLASRGVVPGDRVALLLPDDIPLVVGWLGVLKAGAVCVPLSADHPEDRLRAILADAEPGLLVTHDALWDLASRINGDGASPVSLDRMSASPHETVKPTAVTPGSHAYILYTSGTTGGPKGVIQTHRNLLKNVRAFSELMEVRPEDRLAGLTSFTMGQGVATMFVSLLNGATLYPYHLKTAGLASLASWIQQQQISVYTSSVTVFRQFANLVHAGTPFPHLRVIRLGTEELRIADVELFKERFPRGCVLLNCLGSTETFNYARFRIDHGTVISGKAVPVGFPPEGTTLSLLNEEGKECQEGETGEIIACSAYLSPGYWRDAELTARRFHGEGSHRSYRTGDMGRRLPDGSIEFAGRVDHLVKIRGNRVELGEVEHVLASHPNITAAAVTVHQDADAEAALVAHVATPLPEAEVRSHLRHHLPEFMVPAVIRTMDALPLTPSGKVDREALRSGGHPAVSADAFPEDHTINECETAMAGCWSRVLGGEVPGLHDEFMMAGGDSLKALRLFAEIQVSMGVTFDVRDVSDAFTVASMAKIAEARGWNPQAARIPVALERNADWRFLLRVQAGDDAHPFVIVPGGWGGEAEILLLARVVNALGTGRAVYAVSSRAADPAWESSDGLQEHAAAVLEELRQVIAGRKWTLIGECVAAAVAMELASQAEARELAPEVVVMLDPYTPPGPHVTAELPAFRMDSPRGALAPSQPEGLAAYYRLLKSARPNRIQNDLHVILAGNAKNAGHASEYWQCLTAGRLHLGTVSGTHESYLRRDGAETVARLSKVLFAHPGTQETGALGHGAGGGERRA